MFTGNFCRGPVLSIWPAMLLAVWLAAGAGAARAATITVNSLDDAGAGTLRSAIDLAASGDTIQFEAGLSGTIFLGSPLPALGGNLTIQGPGAGVITINGNSQHRVFFIESGAVVVISGLTIAGGFTDFPNGGTETDGFGGGIVNLGNLTLEDSVLRDNFAEFVGGGVSNEGILNVLRTTIRNNVTDAGGVGGGIDTFGGQVDIVESTISGNLADFGGGISNAGGEMRLASSTVWANDADFGGGISNDGFLALVNSTVSGNEAISDGGGIENFSSENFSGETTLVFSTVTGNSANSGGGILNDGSFSARNSLVANNPTGGGCAGLGAFLATGANMATDGSCEGFSTVTPAALALGTLAENGGPTRTHALAGTSAALDAVTDCTDINGTTSINVDQRGITRPQGTACDLGAFELAGTGAGELIYMDGFEGS